MEQPRASLAKEPLIVTLELLAQLNETTRHEAAAMAFCNEIAYQFKCTRVGLGYLRDGLIEAVAISQTTQFERRLESIRDWEAAMQEATDQDEDLIWPVDPSDHAVTREHERYARRHAVHSLCTLPMRLDRKVCGAVSLIREGSPFSAPEIDALRAMIDLAARRLWDLDRVGGQWWRLPLLQAREGLAELLGPRHTWIKFSAAVGGLFALFLFLIPMPYRVGGDLTIKTTTLVTLPAPFDGYIKTVLAEPGDAVREGEVLVSLDPTELELKKAESIANAQHYQSEAEMAEGQSDVSQMHVYQAQADQAQSQLSQVQYNLGHAELKSPLTGVVVEGKLREKIGSPLRQGEILMKVCRIEDLYIEAEVSEEDIQDIREGAVGQARLESRPGEVFPILVTRIEPAAVAGTKGNVFKVRCNLQGDAPDWWRPGMTGVVRLRAGWRTEWYQWTHRAIDFLRLKFWF